MEGMRHWTQRTGMLFGSVLKGLNLLVVYIDDGSDAALGAISRDYAYLEFNEDDDEVERSRNTNRTTSLRRYTLAHPREMRQISR